MPNDEESDFIPDIIPPEIQNTIAEETRLIEPEKPRPVPIPIPVPAQKTVAPPPIHIHHAIVGLGIAGASLIALFIPQLKPTTRVAVAGLGVTLGLTLLYDDIIQHQESNCDISTIFNFIPCAPCEKESKVKKP